MLNNSWQGQLFTDKNLKYLKNCQVSQVVLTYISAFQFTEGPEVQLWPFLGVNKKISQFLILPASLAFARLESNLLPESRQLSSWKNKSRDGLKMQRSLPGSHTYCVSIPPKYISLLKQKKISFCSFQTDLHKYFGLSHSDATSIIFLRKPSHGPCVQPYRVKHHL